MGRIRQEDVEAVRERTDLVKLVQQYLTLRKVGHDALVGLCPFHAEKTPSLSVSPTKQVYYCFGCGAGGDAVRFLMGVENQTFPEALERLARDAGITLRYEGDSPSERRAASRRQALHRANEEAAAVYHQTLVEAKEGEQARAYLAERGIAPEQVDAFGVGFAPGYGDFLLRRLARRFSPEILVEAGVALRDRVGEVRDRFRDRITFPVHDLGGHAVGFGARALPPAEGEGPKYVNSPETPIYRKGETLYNLHRAKRAITTSGRAFLVEGYTDVIALSQAGVPEAVATCGTALSEGHFRLISRFADHAILAFDSDEAGARAAERAYAFHERYPLRPLVVILPQGLDPAEFIRERGGEAFLELASSAVPLIEYMLERRLARRDLSSVEGRADAVRAALPIISGLRDPVRRDEYAGLLADRAGVSSASVLLELERRVQGGPSEESAPAPRVSPRSRVEWEMLKLLARPGDTTDGIAGKLTPEHFEKPQHRKLFELLRDRKGDVQVLIGTLDDARSVSLLAALATQPLEGDGSPEYVERVRLRLEEFLVERRINDVRARLERLNPTKDPSYEPLFVELIELEGSRRRIRAEAELVSMHRSSPEGDGAAVSYTEPARPSGKEHG